MTKIYGYDTNVYETSIGNIKDMIEPIQDWKVWEYSCTDEEVKRAMTDKSYIEIILEEKDKKIERLNNIINELEKKLLELRLTDVDGKTIVYRLLDKLQELKGDSSNE